jgi:hypothetical protein
MFMQIGIKYFQQDIVRERVDRYPLAYNNLVSQNSLKDIAQGTYVG